MSTTEEICDQPSNQGVIKDNKDAVISDSASKLIAPALKTEPQKSPVPPRNTQRVAAKFADLTLTGGSLKPQIAAKPQILKKPAPTTEE